MLHKKYNEILTKRYRIPLQYENVRKNCTVVANLGTWNKNEKQCGVGLNRYIFNI